MNKKIAKIICISELFISIVMYFTIAYHFDNDPYILRIIPYTNFEATLLRLSIYIIPGLNILASLFGIVFSTKGILFLGASFEILGGILTLHYKGESVFMLIMGIIMLVCGIGFILCVLATKDLKKIGK